ncbi:heme oxygenase [Staphylococcus saccharolyticus]|uniref:Heme oxygenase (staphylobilin-producing) n=1 Tax=Staphylococcus saccharolyticus TaxID=33028 RepID=A0A380H347_9STAP|nr:heme oxygenase [Staphylococcus saccharolyticus]MBL7564947.1 heme oxygenase [Staphylococcus saccharolyticus]MBL7570789.1 heme oxygenase [Staphylococcus saccharolyticus]QQB98655.1 heme oxygenase [Staphylococcus saccharolyticus]QRJ67129.1 heme oxygenase [Staphylococcus saccharolyticus]RTX93535.1 heme oxygenase [Staphylococcus saccharolyticus]
MFVVTNRITVKKGFAEKMALRFTKGGQLQSLKDFNSIEVWQIERDVYSKDLYVNSWWETEEDFKNWVNSDVFKEAHKNSGQSKDPPVINSEIVKAKVLSPLDRL